MSAEWDEYKKVADEKFSAHKAHLLMSNDRFTAIDWRRPGSSDYFASYIVDRKLGSLIIHGDLGDCIAAWNHAVTVADIKQYVKDVPYFLEKFQCSSDKLIYETDTVLDCIINNLFEGDEEIYEYFTDREEYLRFREELYGEVDASIKNGEDFFPTEHLIEMVTDVYDDAWEMLYECGAMISPRVYLWAIGFVMACDQLGM